jgi:hypothetical protein
MDERSEVAGAADDRDVAVLIGTEHRNAQPRHRIEQDRRRVPVVVVEPDADHADRCVHCREEVRIRIGRSVVRHLQHVGAQVGAGGQQRLLGLDLRIAGQQDPHPADLGAQHERRVVRVRVRVVERRCRAEHVEVYGADVEVGPDRRTEHGQVARTGDLRDDLDAVWRIGERTREDARDRASTSSAREPGYVVEVEVGDHEQRDSGDPEVTQAAVDRDRVGPGVDLDGCARTGR